jgi:predicted nucleotide-binding protein
VPDYDFAIMTWAADDSTFSNGTVTASPRDNVVFECGLFMGILGKDRAFIAVAQSIGVWYRPTLVVSPLHITTDLG